MGYVEDDSMVRVDFFKASGEWYTTEGVKWTGNYLFEENVNTEIRNGFAETLRNHLGDRLGGMTAVCLKPYYEHSFPIMLKNGEWNDENIK